MGETKSATGDLPQTTPQDSRQWARHVGVGLLLTLTLGAALWLEWTMFSRLADLELAWASAGAPRVPTRSQLLERVREMNESLFRFQLTEDAAQRDRFHREARRFAELLVESSLNPRSGPGIEPMDAVEQAFEHYLESVSELTERGVRTMRRDTPVEVDKLIREKSQALEAAIEQLTPEKGAAIGESPMDGRREFEILRRTLVGSGVAMIVFLGLAGLQIYRGIMAPELRPCVD